jgi:hypothetical protein
MVPSFNSLCRPWTVVPEIGHGYSGDRYPATIGAVDFSLLERFHRSTASNVVRQSKIATCTEPHLTPGTLDRPGWVSRTCR